MELSKVYPNIDMQQTGSRLKRYMEDLLVKKQMESVSPEIWRQEKSEFENRIIAYRSKFRKLVA